MSDSEKLFADYLKRPGRRRLERVVRAFYPFVWDASLRLELQ